MVNKAQRVGVFVDVQNMYYSAKNLFGSKVDFAQILKHAVDGRSLIRAIAYVIKADIGEEKSFFDALDKIGYEVKSKDLQVFAGGNKKGDWDIGIAMDMIELAPKLDAVVLVSGDGDFAELIRHMKHAVGCRVEVMAFGKSSSSKIREAADNFFDMDGSREFLRKGGRRTTRSSGGQRPAQRSASTQQRALVQRIAVPVRRTAAAPKSPPTHKATPAAKSPPTHKAIPAAKSPPKLAARTRAAHSP